MSKSRNWSAIALAAGLLLAISSASSYAQYVKLARPLFKVVTEGAAGALVVILTTPNRSKAEAAQKANPGSRIEIEELSEEERRRCARIPESCD